MLAALGLQGTKSAAETSSALPVAQAPELRDVASVFVPGPYRLAELAPGKKPGLKQLVHAPWQALVADSHGNVVMKARVGEGTIYAVSEAEVFGNKDLAQADNVVLAGNLLFGGNHGQALFDERLHLHGGQGSGDVAQLPLARLRQTMWLALGAILLYLVGVGMRFGSPTPMLEKPRRSALEYVEALADLYRRAEARPAIWGLLRQSFRRRLAAVAGTRPDLPAASLAATLALRRPVDPAHVQAVLERLETMPEHPSDEELLRVAQQLAAIEEAVIYER
jgi:hypothetical protein